ncbi:hypothetical protein [Solwaraspora sp. WMMD792]|uniref:hypothetical protein n=1 Tax=unclassified Solwaraspora TaxID=2627926 RepID=UPI002416FAD2|nr:hypothetical protein [Solwaraspora sp. WMMD792]MDG4773412.1 hypothetical protein [Solwaraspora sp. WMMD792]
MAELVMAIPKPIDDIASPSRVSVVSWGFSGGVAAGRLGGAVPAATPDWGERR